MRHAGKIALVTGAGRGIGKGCALELARSGADLVINDRPGSSDLAETAADIRALGRSCAAIEADVFSRGDCERLVRSAIEATGHVDILVSNPAYNHRSDFLDYEPDEFERIIRGVSDQRVSREPTSRPSPRRAWGRRKDSFHIQCPRPHTLRAKCSVQRGQSGAEPPVPDDCRRAARHRINVNAIEPGWIDTPGERAVFGEEVIRSEGQKLPWGRIGTIEDVGRAAAFLCSDDADYITGAILRVDGLIVYKDCAAEF